MGDSKPIFSVIIPTYNRAPILPRAVKSVLQQTFQNFEILIVNDASTDETAEVIESFNDKRIIHIQHTRNGGAPAGRNSGIVNSMGKYIAFLDDDDEYNPQFLEYMYAAFEAAPDIVGFGWCGLRWIQDSANGKSILKEEIWQPQFASREEAYLSFLESRRVGTSSGLTFRKKCVDVIGFFDERLRGGAEDTDFLVRMAREFDFLVCPFVLINNYLHASGHLRIYTQGKARDYELIIEKNKEVLNKHTHLWTSMYYKTGWLYYHGNNKPKARYHMQQVLLRNPLHWKTWLALFLFEIFGTHAPAMHSRISASIKQATS